MVIRLILDCLVLVLFCVAAGFNLWDIMLRDAPRKRIIWDAVTGLLVLVLWVSIELNYLLV
jgi:hypothetical protein